MKTKLFTLFVAFIATTALWAQNNVITYTATEKLHEVTDTYAYGFHTKAFNVAISSHDFSNGKGVITFKGNVITIGERAFYGCSSLTSITIPNSVITIEEYAFAWCDGLTSLTIPNSVTTIREHAFNLVNNIVYNGTAIGSPWGAKCVNGYVDGYFVYSDASKTTLRGCSSAATGEIIIPNSVTKIGEYAFYSCSDLTSITIPNSVTIIEHAAFKDCSGLKKTNYTGTIADWCNIEFVDHGPGAEETNPISESQNLFINNIEVKDLVIPNSVDTIKQLSFYDCKGLMSVTIPSSVIEIANTAFWGCSNITCVYHEDYFRTFQSNIFSSSPTYICTNPITSLIVNQKIHFVAVKLTIPSTYYESYDEIGLSNRDYSSAYTTYYSPDENGIIYFDNLSIDLSVYEGLHCYFYAKKGNEYVFNKKDFVEIKGERPIVSCSSSTTQTTITLSNISASTDESVTSLTKGIYYNYKHYEADENNKVILTEVAPNKKCTLQVYGCYNGQYYYGDKKYITTQSINPIVTTSQETPTSIYARGAYTQGDATILSTTLRCNSTANAPQDEEGYFTGLRPKTKYTFTYEVNTKEGGVYSANKEITTSELVLTTLTPKVVSAGTAVVAAETNISDYETNVGFEWRKYDAPESMPSKSGTAILFNGIMEGKLLNLSTDAYWNVRPYYEAADGTRYYGEWITFDPSDFSYFEPTVHTYALATSPTANKVQVRGYVMTGTDDVTEQGFEYWFKGGQKASHRIPNATADSVYRVTASGQVMTAVLEDLAYSSTYTCRAYAIAGGKTYYGEEVQFLTPEDPRPIYTLTVIAGENGSVNTEVSGQYREGEQVTLTATPNVGYLFEQWSDGNTENPYILTIMQDTELTATFKLSESGLTNPRSVTKATKFFHNGNLIIERNGVKYTATGQKVR